MGHIGNTVQTAFTSFDKQTITGDGGATYTLTHNVANEREIEVFVNNVRQEPSVAYNVSGNTLTMTGNVASTDDFYVVFQGKAVQTASHPANNALQATTGTFSGNVDINGNELILDADGDTKIVASTDDVMTFDTAGSERCRVDASGNLLVGTTTGGGTTGTYDGFGALSGGTFFSSATSNRSIFSRRSTDGSIIDFRKDSTTVGSIGTTSTKLTIGSGATGVRFNYAGIDTIAPWNVSTNAQTDGTTSLGYTSTRFDDIYATNGTIQTSDANEKQQIASLTAAEITAATAISKLFKTYKWNSAVTEKGDAARTHTGVIAQQVETAMTDAGLDAGDYAFFISSDWYVDADGNEVEADAEGAIAKNRKGIRYPELLSFVGAATEQRLADIETRLTALENA